MNNTNEKNQCTKCFKEEKKEYEIKKGKLINLILDYAIDNNMSMEEVNECAIVVKESYYKNALIKR